MLDPDDITALQGRISAFTDAESQLVEAQRRSLQAQTEVLAMVATIRSRMATPYDPELVAILRHLYWQQPSIRAQDISAAAGFRYHAEMLRVMGTVPSGIHCTHCGAEFRRTSRSWIPPNHGYYGQPTVRLCDQCRASRDASARRRIDVASLRSEMVTSSPVLAPASDWLAIAALVVAYPPVVNGLPEKEDEYGPRDRDGVWLGWEHGRDIQRELFKASAAGDARASLSVGAAGRLLDSASNVVGWDPSRTVDILSAYTAESAHVLIVRLRRLVQVAREEAQARALVAYPEAD